MRRQSLPPRDDWAETAREHGFDLAAIADGKRYWQEGTAYVFELSQIDDVLDPAIERLIAMSYEAVERTLGDEAALRALDIPASYWDYLRASWRAGERDLYGRFDLVWDGDPTRAPKLLEYNADTPTALYEAAVFQWLWLEQMIERGHLPRQADQWNGIHEKLITAFGALGLEHRCLHLLHAGGAAEDLGTVDYLRDCANQAGLETALCPIEQVGRDADGRFVDLDDRIIEQAFKLYPWEDLLREPFGALIPASGCRFIEPPWKAILSNKGLLALLWRYFEGDDLLVPAYFADEPAAQAMTDYAEKHLFGREGDGVRLVRGATTLAEHQAHYRNGPTIRQHLLDIPTFDGERPVLGAWVVAAQPAGLGIREDDRLITGDDARFVPHVIV